MNYGNLVCNEINSFSVLLFFENFRFFSIVGNVSLYFGELCITNCYFECVYPIRRRFLYIWTYFKDIYFKIFWKHVPEVWTIFVRTVSLIFFDILVLNGPPPPIPGTNVNVPFWWKQIREQIVFKLFRFW